MTREEIDSRRIRFRVRTLLILVAFLGVCAAWFGDRYRLSERLRRAHLENEIKQEQIEILQQRLAVRSSAMQIHYWWASSDEFVQMLTATADEDKFLEMAPSLSQADDKILQAAVQEMAELLAAKDERTKKRAVIALRFMQVQAPARMKDLAPHVVRNLVPLLDDNSDAVVGEVIVTLQAFGPAASDAVASLERKMSDDDDWYAPSAALAVAQIEPSADIGPRLVELVRSKHPNWYHAAFYLSHHVDAETARRVLTDVIEGAKNEEERKVALQALNQIRATGQQP